MGKFIKDSEIQSLGEDIQKTIASNIDKVNQNVQSLTLQYKSEVKAITFTKSDGSVLAVYFKKLHRMNRPSVLNFLTQQQMGDAGALIYKACLLESESSKEITEDDECYDGIILRLALEYQFDIPDKKK